MDVLSRAGKQDLCGRKHTRVAAGDLKKGSEGLGLPAAHVQVPNGLPNFLPASSQQLRGKRKTVRRGFGVRDEAACRGVELQIGGEKRLFECIMQIAGKAYSLRQKAAFRSLAAGDFRA